MQTIAQQKALRRTIERRSVPTAPRDRTIVAHVPHTEQLDGYCDAGANRKPRENASADYMVGFNNRKHEIDCRASVGAQA